MENIKTNTRKVNIKPNKSDIAYEQMENHQKRIDILEYQQQKLFEITPLEDITPLEQKLNQHTQKINKNSEDISIMDNKITYLAPIISQNTSDIDSVLRMTYTNKYDIESIQTNITDINQDLADLNTAVENISAPDFSQLESAISDISETVATLEGGFDDISTDISDIKTDNININNSLQTLQTAHTTLSNTVAEEKAKLSLALVRQNAHTSHFAENDAAIESNTNLINQHTSVITSLISSTGATEAKIANIESFLGVNAEPDSGTYFDNYAKHSYFTTYSFATITAPYIHLYSYQIARLNGYLSLSVSTKNNTPFTAVTELYIDDVLYASNNVDLVKNETSVVKFDIKFFSINEGVHKIHAVIKTPENITSNFALIQDYEYYFPHSQIEIFSHPIEFDYSTNGDIQLFAVGDGYNIYSIYGNETRLGATPDNIKTFVLTHSLKNIYYGDMFECRIMKNPSESAINCAYVMLRKPNSEVFSNFTSNGGISEISQKVELPIPNVSALAIGYDNGRYATMIARNSHHFVYFTNDGEFRFQYKCFQVFNDYPLPQLSGIRPVRITGTHFFDAVTYKDDSDVVIETQEGNLIHFRQMNIAASLNTPSDKFGIHILGKGRCPFTVIDPTDPYTYRTIYTKNRKIYEMVYNAGNDNNEVTILSQRYLCPGDRGFIDKNGDYIILWDDNIRRIPKDSLTTFI